MELIKCVIFSSSPWLGIYTGVEPPLVAVAVTKPCGMRPGALYLHAGEGGAPGEPLLDRPVHGPPGPGWAPLGPSFGPAGSSGYGFGLPWVWACLDGLWQAFSLWASLRNLGSRAFCIFFLISPGSGPYQHIPPAG